MNKMRKYELSDITVQEEVSYEKGKFIIAVVNTQYAQTPKHVSFLIISVISTKNGNIFYRERITYLKKK